MATALPTDIEGNAGVEPLERLQARYRELLEEYAPLFAAERTYNDRRKVVLGIREIAIREAAKEAGEKITDKAMDALAHADLEYGAWLDNEVKNLTRFAVLRGEIEMITQEVNRGQAVLRGYAAEART